MLPKLRLENREPFDVAVPADSGDFDADGDDWNAVRSLRSELRGWRGWNLLDGMLVGDVLVMDRFSFGDCSMYGCWRRVEYCCMSVSGTSLPTGVLLICVLLRRADTRGLVT